MAVMRWTHEQFSEMSWHDNHVHALRVVEGPHGTGELILDLDYVTSSCLWTTPRPPPHWVLFRSTRFIATLSLASATSRRFGRSRSIGLRERLRLKLRAMSRTPPRRRSSATLNACAPRSATTVPNPRCEPTGGSLPLPVPSSFRSSAPAQALRYPDR